MSYRYQSGPLLPWFPGIAEVSIYRRLYIKGKEADRRGVWGVGANPLLHHWLHTYDTHACINTLHQIVTHDLNNHS